MRSPSAQRIAIGVSRDAVTTYPNKDDDSFNESMEGCEDIGDLTPWPASRPSAAFSFQCKDSLNRKYRKFCNLCDKDLLGYKLLKDILVSRNISDSSQDECAGSLQSEFRSAQNSPQSMKFLPSISSDKSEGW